jgi:hypothetical protein
MLTILLFIILNSFRSNKQVSSIKLTELVFLLPSSLV